MRCLAINQSNIFETSDSYGYGIFSILVKNVFANPGQHIREQ